MIPRYSLPEIAALFTDDGALRRWLEVEVLAVEAWATLGVVPEADARAVRERAGFDVAAIDERETGHRPRRRRVRRRRAGARRSARRALGALRPDVERRRRHRARAADDARRRPARRRGRRARERDREAGRASSATRRWSGAPTASTPNPPPSAPSSRSGPCRCGATASGWRRARATIAVGKLSGAVGTYSNVDPAVEALRLRAPRPAAGAGHAGAAPRPARRGHVRVRVDRRERRGVRARDPPPAAHRGARGRGRLPRRAQKGSSAMPHKRNPIKSRADVRAGPRRCAANLQAGARGRRALARARHLALVGRADHPARLARCSPTTCSVKFRQVVENLQVHPERMLAQPRRVVRSRVQPAGAARAGRSRAHAATTPTGSCSATRCARGSEAGRSVDAARAPTPR